MQEICLPNSLVYANLREFSKLGESFLVLEIDLTNAPFTVFNMWTIKNDVGTSVTKLFTITSQNAMIKDVFGFTKSGLPIV